MPVLLSKNILLFAASSTSHRGQVDWCVTTMQSQGMEVRFRQHNIIVSLELTVGEVTSHSVSFTSTSDIEQLETEDDFDSLCFGLGCGLGLSRWGGCCEDRQGWRQGNQGRLGQRILLLFNQGGQICSATHGKTEV